MAVRSGYGEEIRGANNNTMEGSLRSVCPGENYMSFSSAHGGKYGTLLYGLIRICWLNSIVQEVYLHQVYLLTTSCAYTCIPFFYIY